MVGVCYLLAPAALLPGRGLPGLPHHPTVAPRAPRVLGDAGGMVDQIQAWIKSEDIQSALSSSRDDDGWEDDWELGVTTDEAFEAAVLTDGWEADAPAWKEECLDGAEEDTPRAALGVDDGMADQLQAWIGSKNMQSAISSSRVDGWEDALELGAVTDQEVEEETDEEPWEEECLDEDADADAVLAVPGQTAPSHARPLDEADEAPFVARALREERHLGAGEELPPCKRKQRRDEGAAAAQARHAATAVAEGGVARLAGCLSAETAAALRAHVLDQFHCLGGGGGGCNVGGEEEEEEEEGFRLMAVGSGTQRVSARAQGGAAAAGETRWDVRLETSAPPVRAALRELLVVGAEAGEEAGEEKGEEGGEEELAALGAAVARLVGGDAALWELAAIISAPGAAPQVVHADATWTAAPLLLTAFVALQRVTRRMGPTRFLPRTHADPAPAAALLDGGDATALPPPPGARVPPSRVALLEAGDVALYDGRLLHCGGANRSDELRVLFYLTFRAAGTDGAAVGADATTLEQLVATLRQELSHDAGSVHAPAL